MLAHMRYFSRTAPFELETELNRCLSDPWFTRNFCKPRSTDTKNKGTSSDNCACLLAQAGNRSLETGGLTGRFKNVDPSLYFKRRNPKVCYPVKIKFKFAYTTYFFVP